MAYNTVNDKVLCIACSRTTTSKCSPNVSIAILILPPIPYAKVPTED